MPPRLARTGRSSSRSSKRSEPAPSPTGAVVAVGEIVGAHALRGWLRLRAYQPPAPSLVPGRRVWIAQAGACRELEVRSAAPSPSSRSPASSTDAAVRLHVLALFPEMLASPLAAGVLRRARERGVVEVCLHQLRDYATGRHLEVDDAPYGGGPGMVMRPE